MNDSPPKHLIDVVGLNGFIIDGDWVESKDQDPQGDVRLVQLADVGEGVYVNKSARFLTSEKARQLGCTFLKEGDILVARMPDPIGRACLFPGDPKPCVTVVDVCVVRPDPEIADTSWLCRAINSEQFRHGIGRFVKGTTRQRISRTNLERVEIPLPPLHEQRRIAAILDKANELRAKRQAALKTLNYLPKAVFVEMFGDPDSNTRRFTSYRLGDVTRIGTGTTPSRATAENYGGEVPWVKTTEVHGWEITNTEERITLSAAKSSRAHVYPVDSIVVALYGQGKTRGRCAILRTAAATNQACGVLLPGVNHTPEFLKVFLDLSYERLRSLSRGGNQENLNLRILSDFKIFLPPPEMQRQFSERINAIRRCAMKCQASSRTFDSLMQSLQSRAFTGAL